MSKPDHAMDRAIQQCLQPEVITLIRGNIYHFGHLQNLLSQYDNNLFHQSLYISTWRALQEDSTLPTQPPKVIADAIYRKLGSQVRSKGRDQLGDGARRKSTLFNNYTISLQQNCLEQIPAPDPYLDVLAYEELLQELQHKINAIYINNPTLRLKIAKKRNSVLTEIRRSKKLQELLIRTAEVLDSPAHALSLLQYLLLKYVN